MVQPVLLALAAVLAVTGGASLVLYRRERKGVQDVEQRKRELVERSAQEAVNRTIRELHR